MSSLIFRQSVMPLNTFVSFEHNLVLVPSKLKVNHHQRSFCHLCVSNLPVSVSLSMKFVFTVIKLSSFNEGFCGFPNLSRNCSYGPLMYDFLASNSLISKHASCYWLWKSKTKHMEINFDLAIHLYFNSIAHSFLDSFYLEKIQKNSFY